MSKNKILKEIKLSLFVSIVIILTLQVVSFGFPGGSGEPNDPYQISTASISFLSVQIQICSKVILY